MNKAELYIKTKLDERQAAGNYRRLRAESGMVDFCSNDYLGFARSSMLRQAINNEVAGRHEALNGATGSRLLAGNTCYVEELEEDIANFQGYPSGLIYNSGYDANIGLFSSVPQKGDTLITDELIHASIIDGARLSYANRYKFKHNDLNSLQDKLKSATGNIYIAVESVYSMDGDSAPLVDIVNLALEYGAHLIVDEAHAVGVFGKGLVDQLGLQAKVFAQVVTFGKALGCHGAIILGSEVLREYLINFSRSFIYTTAAPFHQLAAIKMAYQLLPKAGEEQQALRQNISFFKENFSTNNIKFLSGNSAIQGLLLGSNAAAKGLADMLQAYGFDTRLILSPTVAIGTERLRVCLHAYNTIGEINGLLAIINDFKV